jgi:hypothetical protein
MDLGTVLNDCDNNIEGEIKKKIHGIWKFGLSNGDKLG